MGMVHIYLHQWLIFIYVYGFHVGKYTVRPMDPMGYTLPYIIMEVENRALKDELNLQNCHFPLP